MEDILKKLSEHAEERVKQKKNSVPFSEVRAIAEAIPKGWFPFSSALNKPGISYICEIKKASPSKGTISEDFLYLDIAKEYDQAGIDAISVVTEPKWFLGCEEHLGDIAENVRVPLIRKDIIIDPYMIYEAKTKGASAINIICSVLDENRVRDYIEIAESVGISVLVETSDAVEIEMAIRAGAQIIGVNNRNLKDFSVDISNSTRLRSLVPPNIKFVSEGGINSLADINIIKASRVDGVIIGEACMRAHNKKKFLDNLKGISESML